MGHNGAVCALATNQELVMTGSRDRLIKLYEIDAVLSQSEASPTHSQSTPSHVSVCVCLCEGLCVCVCESVHVGECVCVKERECT